MIIMSYANYYNKVRLIFILFDFDGNQAIDLDEIAIMVVCFLEGWGKMISQDMPARRYIKTFAEIIYQAAEYVPNGKITIKEIGDWVDTNESLMKVLDVFEPQGKISQKNYIYLPMKRKGYHIKSLSRIYLEKYELTTHPEEKKSNEDEENKYEFQAVTTKNQGKDFDNLFI